MKKQKIQSTPKTKTKQKTLTSNTDKILKDIQKLITKHSGLRSDENVTLYEESNTDKGFYLIFIKRDEKEEKEHRLQVTEFAAGINVNDLIAAMADIINSHMNLQKTIDYKA